MNSIASTHKALQKPTILPILLSPPTLRPLAFRTFTKKYNLTLASSALNSLASFIGQHCGAGWREEGLAERVLEEVAKAWKQSGGGVIVEGDGRELKSILENLEGCMAGGRIVSSRAPSRQNSFASKVGGGLSLGSRSTSNVSSENEHSFRTETSMSDNHEDAADEEYVQDTRRWLKVISAFDHPRLSFNVSRKHFESITTPASLFPDASHKTQMYRDRYNVIHQRLLRNEAFQKPTITPAVPSLRRSSSSLTTTQEFYKITQIANLLGRSGSTHMLLGLMIIAPTGGLAITDLSGSIALDLQHAKAAPNERAPFTPGMIVLVEGIYEEDYNVNAGALGGGGGVGGLIGGAFIGVSIGGPPCERREVTLGLTPSSGSRDTPAGGGFGWVDFLGVGSERALGSRMRRIEQRCFAPRSAIAAPATPTSISSSPAAADHGRTRIAILGEIHLDRPRTLGALRRVLSLYAALPPTSTPLAMILVGNFVSLPSMSGGGSGSGGSIEYKEHFDALASVLSDFPTLLSTTTFVFVPGDYDPFASAFSAGAATVVPRKPIPDVFTTRIQRAFRSANTEADRAGRAAGEVPGEAIWTTNPARISLFGPRHEMVLFRDDISSRLRRNALRFRGPSPIPAPASPVELTSSDTATDPPSIEIDSSVRTATSGMPPPSTPSVSESARLLAKTLLDQGSLSPFPLSQRPVLWDRSGALSLYPLPTVVVLVDAEMEAFVVPGLGATGGGQVRGGRGRGVAAKTSEDDRARGGSGWVINPGRFVSENGTARGREARWVEWDTRERSGEVRAIAF